MRNWRFIGIVLVLVILIDLYVFQAVKALSQGSSAKARTLITGIYWGLSLTSLIIFALLPLVTDPAWQRTKSYIFFTIMAFFFAKLIAAVFFLIDDIRRLIQWASGRLFFNNTEGDSDDSISRSAFLSWLGIGLGGTLFSSLVYGFTNKYNYHVRKVKLSYDNLPPAFKGLKIVQLSDIHSGSLADRDAVAKGIDRVLAESPDLILFTGDLVNDVATEMDDYKDLFSRLK